MAGGELWKEIVRLVGLWEHSVGRFSFVNQKGIEDAKSF